MSHSRPKSIARMPRAARRKPRAAAHPPAFTLVELLIASIITVFIAGATTTAISQALKARTATQARLQARARADAAAGRIADDLQHAVRDTDLFFARLVVMDGGDQPDELLFYMRSHRVVRPLSGQPEGDEYEVQYRLAFGEPDGSSHRPEAGGTGGHRPEAGATGSLWRRVDPVPDEYPDGGGVASPIVDGLTSLSVEATDGLLWYTTWDSDADGYPHAVRIVLTASDDTGRTTATARRTIALDRTPQPYDTLLERIAEEEDGG